MTFDKSLALGIDCKRSPTIVAPISNHQAVAKGKESRIPIEVMGVTHRKSQVVLRNTPSTQYLGVLDHTTQDVSPHGTKNPSKIVPGDEDKKVTTSVAQDSTPNASLVTPSSDDDVLYDESSESTQKAPKNPSKEEPTAKKSLFNQAYEMMNGQQSWNQCLDCAFKIPHEYFPPSAIGTPMKCPLCSVKYYIKRVKMVQANMAQRGGIIYSKSRISYTERGTHYAHDPEFQAHKGLKLQWSQVKKMSLKNLARWENRLQKRMRRLNGKPLNPKWQNMADAVNLYYSKAEELAYVPGSPYEEEAEAEANYIEATVEEVTARWNSKHSIPKSEAPRTSTVWYRARKEQMAQGSPTYLVATLKSCLQRRRKSDPPITPNANRELHIDNPDTVQTTIRFNDKVEVCSDALTFEPDPFPLRSKIDITPNFWILPSSPLPALSAPTTFIPFKDPFSTVRYRPKSQFTRKRKVYRPGAWASPEGYEKIDTSFYKISPCKLASSDDLREREREWEVSSRLDDIARSWVESAKAREKHRV